jgi:hypothetical protein
MAVTGGPSIIKSNLSLCLDAADTLSYPGSGTTWNDLSTNNYSHTLTGSPAYNSSTGYFSFNGSTQFASYAGNVVPAGDSSKSISVWFRSNNIATRQWIIYAGTESLGTRFCLEIDSSKFTFNYFADALRSSTLLSNTWYNGVVSYNSSTKVLACYINGSLSYTATFPISGYSLVTGTTANTVIARFATSSFFFNGDISLLNVYSRNLSDAEVLQNFNAARGRFGV